MATAKPTIDRVKGLSNINTTSISTTVVNNYSVYRNVDNTTIHTAVNNRCGHFCENLLFYIILIILLCIAILMILYIICLYKKDKNNKIEPGKFESKLNISNPILTSSTSNISVDTISTESFEVKNNRFLRNDLYGDICSINSRVVTNDIYGTAETAIDSTGVIQPNYAHLRHLSNNSNS